MNRLLILLLVAGLSVTSCATLPSSNPNLDNVPSYATRFTKVESGNNTVFIKDNESNIISLQAEQQEYEESTINSMVLTREQFDLLNLSNRVLQKFKEQDDNSYKQLESAPGYAVFKVYDVHLLLGAIGKGNGIVYDNVHKKIRFLNIKKLNAGLGLGYTKQYLIVKITDNSKLATIMSESATKIDTNLTLMLGFWGRQYSILPGYSILKLYTNGFDIGYQWGPVLYTNGANIQESAITIAPNNNSKD